MKIRFSLLILVTSLLGLSTLVLGMIVPLLLINSGENQYTSEEQIFVRFALEQAKQMFTGSGETMLVVAYRATKLKNFLGEDNGACAYDPFIVSNQYRVQVNLYTWFGIPYGKVEVDCHENKLNLERYFFSPHPLWR